MVSSGGGGMSRESVAPRISGSRLKSSPLNTGDVERWTTVSIRDGAGASSFRAKPDPTSAWGADAAGRAVIAVTWRCPVRDGSMEAPTMNSAVGQRPCSASISRSNLADLQIGPSGDADQDFLRRSEGRAGVEEGVGQQLLGGGVGAVFAGGLDGGEGALGMTSPHARCGRNREGRSPGESSSLHSPWSVCASSSLANW